MGVGNVRFVTDARDNTMETQYDNANRPVKVIQPAVTGGTPETVTTYDGNGNVLTVTDPEDNATTNTYDALNRLITTTDAENILVTNQYDAAGNRTAIIDGEGRRTEFVYDGLNRNTKITYGANDTSIDYSEIFTFDALNKIQRIDDSSITTTYDYDARQRLINVTYPSSDDTNANRTYAYDLVGNLLSVIETKAGGASAKSGKADVAYTYDGLNRVLTETSQGATHTYTYDKAGNRLSALYGGTNRKLVSLYDDLNRLLEMFEDEDGDGVCDPAERKTTYSYDLNGNIVEKELPNRDACAMVYDALNRKTSMTGSNGGNSLYTFTYLYDLVGNVTEIDEDYPSNGDVKATDRTVVNSYDSIYRLETETIVSSETTETSYTYDDSHNRLGKSVKVDDTPTDSWTYAYNALNQLTEVTGSSSVSYTYDNKGNRATRVEGGNTDTYGYDIEKPPHQPRFEYW
jgi:YD repeat-containing protein